jgi:hypothetical protein
MQDERTPKVAVRRQKEAAKREYSAPVLQKREKLSEISRGLDHKVS